MNKRQRKKHDLNRTRRAALNMAPLGAMRPPERPLGFIAAGSGATYFSRMVGGKLHKHRRSVLD